MKKSRFYALFCFIGMRHARQYNESLIHHHACGYILTVYNSNLIYLCASNDTFDDDTRCYSRSVSEET